MGPSETRGSRSLGRLPSILCQATTWQPGCAQAYFSWPSAGRHSWPHCQPITEGCGSPMPVFASDVSVFLGPLSHSLLQLSIGLQTVGRATIPGPTGTRGGEQQLWLSPPLLSTHIHPPFLHLCFDFLCVRPTMGNQCSASSSSLQGKRQTMKPHLGEIAEVV